VGLLGRPFEGLGCTVGVMHYVLRSFATLIGWLYHPILVHYICPFSLCANITHQYRMVKPSDQSCKTT